MKALRLSTSRRAGTVTVVVSGEVDMATIPELKRCLWAALGECGNGSGWRERCDQRVVVELGDVMFIDATGLGMLVGALNRANLQRTVFLLANVTPMLERLLAITGLTDRFARLE
jgi:anti-sigma B factor antagonist